MSISSKIQSLITAANSVTGESRTDLTAAVQDLKDGYGGGGLPAEYEAVEYIESTGTQYIDTRVIPNKFTTTKLDYSLTAVLSGNKYLFGVSVSGDLIQFYGAYCDANKVYCRQTWGGSNGYNYNYYSQDTNRHILVFGGASFFVTDGNSSYYLSRAGSGVAFENYENTNNLSIFLPSNNQSGSAVNTATLKIYGCKIYNNATGEKYRDFIPCVRDSDSEAGLYDLVNGVFYTNQGTGDFVVPT